VTPKTILVVDDESHLLDTIQFILQSNGYAALPARGGEEALERLAALKAAGGRVDLILTDLQMPGPTGLELVQRLREAGERAPVLVMTGYSDRETARRLRERGIEHFLDKPFEEGELLRRIRELLTPASPRSGGPWGRSAG
jgi:CheY-like chemotaxis protein